MSEWANAVKEQIQNRESYVASVRETLNKLVDELNRCGLDAGFREHYLDPIEWEVMIGPFTRVLTEEKIKQSRRRVEIDEDGRPIIYDDVPVEQGLRNWIQAEFNWD